MKSGGQKILLIAVFFIVTGGSAYWVGKQVFGACSYRFALDERFSCAMHKAIKDAVCSSCCTSLAAVSEAVCAVCPALAHISIERQANNQLFITVQSMEPYVAIGNKVLTAAAKVVEQSCFSCKALEMVPVVMQKNAHGKETITDELKQWLLRLDPSVFALYAIVWIDDYAIQLKDKQTMHPVMLCSVQVLPDQSKRELCQRIIEEKISSAQGTARKHAYTADIRFEKQIVVCSQRGGACNG